MFTPNAVEAATAAGDHSLNAHNLYWVLGTPKPSQQCINNKSAPAAFATSIAPIRMGEQRV